MIIRCQLQNDAVVFLAAGNSSMSSFGNSQEETTKDEQKKKIYIKKYRTNNSLLSKLFDQSQITMGWPYCI